MDIHTCILNDQEKQYIIMGDLKTRVGDPMSVIGDCHHVSYQEIEDKTVNTHGRRLLTICKDTGLRVVNNPHIEKESKRRPIIQKDTTGDVGS